MAEAEQERLRCAQCGNNLRQLHKLTDTRTGKVSRVYECIRCATIEWDD